jgi:hypothetical protein
MKKSLSMTRAISIEAPWAIVTPGRGPDAVIAAGSAMAHHG